MLGLLTPPPKKKKKSTFWILPYSSAGWIFWVSLEMKEKLISFRKKKERMDTHETEQPFTVIKKKKSMARNYTLLPFQVTVHQQAGHSESASPLGAALMYPVFFRNYTLAWDLWAASRSFPDTLLMGENRKLPVLLLRTSAPKCPTKLLWPLQVTSSQGLQRPFPFPFVILFKLWILNWL